MKKHHAYLSTVFNQIKDSIHDEKKQGVFFKSCPSCQFESCKQSKITDNVVNYKCLVCSFEEEVIIIYCPECENSIEITEIESEPFECLECGYQINNEYIAEILDTEITTRDNYKEPTITINCANCCKHDSGIIHHDLFICSNCHTISKYLAHCDWCIEGQIAGGDLEDSFLDGCEFCDGRLGHLKDD